MKLLIINPGSTSTKISVYEDENKLFEENIFHDAPELLKYPHVNGQIPFLQYGSQKPSVNNERFSYYYIVFT